MVATREVRMFPGTMSSKTQPPDVLDLRSVSRIFDTPAGPFRALDGIDYRVTAGRFVAVVGKSGSGKSTLVNLVTGIDRPSTGSIVVAGEPLHARGESHLAAFRGRHIGIVFQSFQLLPTLTVLENVMLPMDFCATFSGAAARRRALSLLADVGIEDQADKLPSALSGGQQQRAAIARALANDPAIVVADEPTGNLDSQTANEVTGLFAGLARAGKTVVMVTHERDVSRFADEVVTLADGRVVDISRKGEGVHHAA
jgi:putative ABC transport system ATP-binding protein